MGEVLTPVRLSVEPLYYFSCPSLFFFSFALCLDWQSAPTHAAASTTQRAFFFFSFLLSFFVCVERRRPVSCLISETSSADGPSSFSVLCVSCVIMEADVKNFGLFVYVTHWWCVMTGPRWVLEMCLAVKVMSDGRKRLRAVRFTALFFFFFSHLSICPSLTNSKECLAPCPYSFFARFDYYRQQRGKKTRDSVGYIPPFFFFFSKPPVEFKNEGYCWLKKIGIMEYGFFKRL